jgi:hypothetical protein
MTKWRWGTNMTTKADVLQDVKEAWECLQYIGPLAEMGFSVAIKAKLDIVEALQYIYHILDKYDDDNKMISFSDLIEIDSWLSVIEKAAVL